MIGIFYIYANDKQVVFVDDRDVDEAIQILEDGGAEFDSLIFDVGEVPLSALRDQFLALDNCEICKGSKGGVKGNENVVNGTVMCDYCSVKFT